MQKPKCGCEWGVQTLLWVAGESSRQCKVTAAPQAAAATSPLCVSGDFDFIHVSTGFCSSDTYNLYQGSVNKETWLSTHTGEMLLMEALGFMENIFELLLTRHESWIFAFPSRC